MGFHKTIKSKNILRIAFFKYLSHLKQISQIMVTRIIILNRSTQRHLLRQNYIFGQ